MTPPIELRRERDFSQKINATFQFVVQNFRPLSFCLVYIVVPVLLVAGIAGGVYQSKLLSFFGEKPTVNTPLALPNFMGRVFSPEYAVLIVFTVLGILLLSLTTYAYLAEYETGQRPPAVAAVWARVRRSLLPAAGMLLLLGLGLVLIVGVLVGLFAAAGILPMAVLGGFVAFGLILYFSVAYSLGFAVLVQEEAGVFGSLQRSYDLVRGKWWSTLGLSAVVGLVTALVGYVFQLPAVAVMALKAMSVLSGEQTLLFILTTLFATIGTTLLRTLVALALGFQYYNLVELKEGTGLLSELERLGTAPSANPFSGDEGDF